MYIIIIVLYTLLNPGLVRVILTLRGIYNKVTNYNRQQKAIRIQRKAPSYLQDDRGFVHIFKMHTSLLLDPF